MNKKKREGVEEVKVIMPTIELFLWKLNFVKKNSIRLKIRLDFLYSNAAHPALCEGQQFTHSYGKHFHNLIISYRGEVLIYENSSTHDFLMNFQY